MKCFLTLFLLLLSVNVFAQDNSYVLFDLNSSKTQNPSAEVKNLVDDAVILNLKQQEFESIFNARNYRLNINLPVDAQRNVNLVLERYDVLKPGAKIVEKNAAGEVEHDLSNVIVSYKGYIQGLENSLVVINFYNNTVTGLMKSANDTYVLGELTDNQNRPTGDFIIYQDSKIRFPRNMKCGSDVFDVPAEIMQRMNTLNMNQSDNGFSTLLKADVAIDVDFYTYNLYGSSVPNATAYALALMSATSAVYMKDLNIQLFVSYLRVWTTPDPYTSTNGPTLLDQFRTEWVNTQGGVQRVIAHLVTRRNNLDVAGIAYLNVLCNTGFGYGLSATLNGMINQLPTYSYDVVVIAHEMGHNFGSPHTHNCSWPGGPIDTCWQIEGGCYFGPTHPTAGTIMSYCDIVPGGSVIMDFGPLPEQLIRNTAEGAFCIVPNPSTLLLAYPNGGETFSTNSNAKIYWGTSLTGNVNLEYSTNGGSSWTTIQNNVNAQLREFNWTVPYIGSSPQSRVRIYDSSNPSIGDTSNANFKIKLVFNSFPVQSPPSNTIIGVSQGDPATVDFTWNKAASVAGLTYKWSIRKLVPGAPEYLFLSNNSGSDTVISVTKSKLDSLAQLMGGSAGDTVRTVWKVYAYSGTDSASSSNAAILSLIRTTVGIEPISSVIPEKFNLENNYPNPFNPTTKIRFDVAKNDLVKITVYDMLGRKVTDLVNEILAPGKYQVDYNAMSLSSGIYYYRMETSDYRQTKKMILIK